MPGQPAETLISSAKPLSELDLQKKFVQYFGKTDFKYLGWRACPVAKKGAVAIRRADGSEKRNRELK